MKARVQTKNIRVKKSTQTKKGIPIKSIWTEKKYRLKSSLQMSF